MKLKTFLPLVAVVAALLVSCKSAPKGPDQKFTVGLQTYTCRNMSFDEVVDFAVKHHLKYLQMFKNHIDPNGPVEETKRKKAILDQHGLVCYTFGVNRTTTDKEQNRKLFEFAKLMGCKLIVVEPKDMAEWDNLEELVKQYDIRLAIHNHGLSSTYGNPATVLKVLHDRDARIGVCLDVGHLTGAGFEAAKTFREYRGRVFDIHLKDKRTEVKDGKKHELDVFIGTGDTKYKEFFAELAKDRWHGVMAIETDNSEFAQAPDAFVDAAIKYVHENWP